MYFRSISVATVTNSSEAYSHLTHIFLGASLNRSVPTHTNLLYSPQPLLNLLELRQALLDGIARLPDKQPEVNPLVILEPRRSLEAGVRLGVRGRELAEPVLLDADVGSSGARFTEHEMLVLRLGVGVVEAAEDGGEGRGLVVNIVVRAHDVHVIGARPVGAHVGGRGAQVGRPEEQAAFDVGDGRVHVLPGLNEFRGGFEKELAGVLKGGGSKEEGGRQE